MKLNEAITISQYRPYHKVWIKSNGPKKYEQWFKGKHRIYIDLNNTSDDDIDNSSRQNVVSLLEENGYVLESYKKGLCKKQNDKRLFRIGSILQSFINNYEKNTSKRWQKTAYEDVLQDYNNDKERIQEKDYIIVISRHAYDIAGMTSGRGWRSCMNLSTGTRHSYVEQDVKHGTLIAYLIKNNDKNINDPIARVLIKPFINVRDPKDYYLMPEPKIYGTAPNSFYETVKKWFEEKQKIGKAAFYRLNDDLYRDEIDREIIRNVKHQRISFAVTSTKENSEVLEKMEKKDLIRSNWENRELFDKYGMNSAFFLYFSGYVTYGEKQKDVPLFKYSDKIVDEYLKTGKVSKSPIKIKSIKKYIKISIPDKKARLYVENIAFHHGCKYFDPASAEISHSDHIDIGLGKMMGYGARPCSTLADDEIYYINDYKKFTPLILKKFFAGKL